MFELLGINRHVSYSQLVLILYKLSKSEELHLNTHYSDFYLNYSSIDYILSSVSALCKLYSCTCYSAVDRFRLEYKVDPCSPCDVGRPSVSVQQQSLTSVCKMLFVTSLGPNQGFR